MDENPVEAVLGQHRAERRGNRDAALGVEAIGVMGEEAIQGSALPQRRARNSAPAAKLARAGDRPNGAVSERDGLG